MNWIISNNLKESDGNVSSEWLFFLWMSNIWSQIIEGILISDFTNEIDKNNSKLVLIKLKY